MRKPVRSIDDEFVVSQDEAPLTVDELMWIEFCEIDNDLAYICGRTAFLRLRSFADELGGHKIEEIAKMPKNRVTARLAAKAFWHQMQTRTSNKLA